jgi:hypothetical protein
VVTSQEIQEVAEKTGLEAEEVRSKLIDALLRTAAYVKIAGPKNEVRIELFSIKVSPEEGALARKWISEHAADMAPVPDHIDGAVDVGSLESTVTSKDLDEIAKVAKTIHDKNLRTIYANDVRAKKKRYIKPQSPPSSNWFEIAAREFEAWEHRARISDNKIKHRLENLRKSSETRRNCPDWFRDDVAVFVVLLLKHSWETRPDKIIAEDIRREFDAVKYWIGEGVSDDSPLLGMTDAHIRVTVDRFRQFGNANLPPKPAWKTRSFEDIALFLWQLLLNTPNPKMTHPFEAFRRAMQLSHQLLKIPIPLHPRYLKTHPPDSPEKMA